MLQKMLSMCHHHDALPSLDAAELDISIVENHESERFHVPEHLHDGPGVAKIHVDLKNFL